LSKERVGEKYLEFSRETLSQADLSRRSGPFTATSPKIRGGEKKLRTRDV
jgi:hypothetical protein